MQFKAWIRAWLADDEGLTTTEYAIAGALVGAAIVLAFTDLGQAIAAVISYMASVF